MIVVYEDADLFIVDKPAGVVVHPAMGHHGDTLLDALEKYAPAVSSPAATERPRLVHRLDKDTSGLLVVARTLQAHRYLSYQWRRQFAVKRYLALVHGRPRPPSGQIDLPLARDPQNRQRVIPAPAGQPARTRYTTTMEYDGFSLLDVQIETGRTHQIRVHLAALGHPIVGDSWYGHGLALPGLSRQFLHAYLLVIRLPSTQQSRAFRSPLPPELAAVLSSLQDTPAPVG